MEDPAAIVDYITQTCEYALIAEVSATPKPGLVDLHDSGAHKDMDVHTFFASAKAITPYLGQMADTGFHWRNTNGDGLFKAIRPIGIQAEQAMYTATAGVNTHKGMIFSMGLIAAVSAWYYQQYQHFQAEDILTHAGRICFDTLEHDFKQINPQEPKTHGELLYIKYGQKGIRGEAQEGFLALQKNSLPTIRNFSKPPLQLAENELYLNVLLSLMTVVDDTNVLTRTDQQTLAYMQLEAKQLLACDGAANDSGIQALRQLNETFIKKNISPGGCADLLALTIFLWKLEQYQN